MKHLKTFENFETLTPEEHQEKFLTMKELVNEAGLEIVGEYISDNGFRLFFTKKSFQKLVIEVWHNRLKWEYTVLDIDGNPHKERTVEKTIITQNFLSVSLIFGIFLT